MTMPENKSNTDKKIFILGSGITVLTWERALERLYSWSSRGESRYVCICNVHSVVTARRDDAFQKVINNADMATPDGMPLAWVLRKSGCPQQQRINGPDLMWKYCALAEKNGHSVYCYGSTDQTLKLLEEKLKRAFPLLNVVFYSPPFRHLTDEEDQGITDRINRSGAGVVFVGLGCPKQERWMAAHKGRINAVMIGVGAAFDYHAGVVRRAPRWMQNAGLEWLHRLASEPRRLWKRYLFTNSLFLFSVTAGFFRNRGRDRPAAPAPFVFK